MMINIVLMLHGSGNLICILSYSGNYFPPVGRLCVWVVCISHLNIPQKVPFKGRYPGNTVNKIYIWPSSVSYLVRWAG